MEKSRIEADTHLGERQQPDRKQRWPKLPTAQVLCGRPTYMRVKAEQVVPYIRGGFKALGSIHPPPWNNPLSFSQSRCLAFHPSSSSSRLNASERTFPFRSYSLKTQMLHKEQTEFSRNKDFLGSPSLLVIKLCSEGFWGVWGKEKGRACGRWGCGSTASSLQPEQSAFI